MFSVASVISLTAISLQLRRRKHSRWLSKIEPETDEYFSHTFNEARLKFRNACSKIPNCKTHAIMINKLDDITIDMCYIPCTQKNDIQHLFIHCSGIHGVEGYAGSAIQCKILSQIANGDCIIDPQSHYLFIHAINGYGMKHNRRFNCFSVDLNRNCFLNAKKWIQMKSRPETLVGYHTIDPYININRVPIFPWDDMVFAYHIIRMVLFKFGSLGMLGRALVTGQYHKAVGVFYGGFQLQKELQSVISFILKDCETVWNVNLRDLIFTPIIDSDERKVHKLTIVDVHTGLGSKGVDTLLGDALHLKKCGILLGNEYIANPLRMQSFASDKKMSVMYKYMDGGFTKGLFKALLKPERFLMADEYETDDESNDELKTDERFAEKPIKYDGQKLDVISIAQEYGTKPSFLVARAVIFENCAYHNCNTFKRKDTENLKYWKKEIRNVFYLENDVEWKYTILQSGTNLFSKLANR